MAATLTLDTQEVKVLNQILDGDRSRLINEIAHTDHREFRDYLKQRETILTGIIDKLK